ncbi:MAG: carbohydrate-binding domain-containing protein [Lachnospiraceae bacterium]|nr:carbohydrate-binding domain-containing protein [Lachnospiraceae bacterium]
MRKRIIAIVLSGILACSVTACGSKKETTVTEEATQTTALLQKNSSTTAAKETTAENNQETTGKTETEQSVTDSSATGSSSNQSGTSQSATGQTKVYQSAASQTTASETTDISDVFTERDLNQSPEVSSATTITVSDGKTIKITEEGIYVIKGTATNCIISVEADKEAKVQLVLDGVNITNTDHSAIYVISADKCFVTTVGTSKLSVTGTFSSDGTTGDAVIYSKDDLVLNGTGQLTVISSYGNGITGKDDVKITGGTYDITSAKDSIEANDSIAVYDGNFTIRSSKDGLHSEYSDDDTAGWIYIAGGNFNITASGDGIQATTIARIDGGNFELTAGEGIEATYVQINSGIINISASDDGINASRKSSTYATPVIEINGGTLTIVMGQGDTDAIDSNGNIIVNGGTINITAQVSSFDYDGTAQYNGGTIIINGTQVNSIPQSMMGGMGGMNGGNGMGEMGGMNGGNGTNGTRGMNGGPGGRMR